MFKSVPLPKDSELTASIREMLHELPPLNVFRMMANIPPFLPIYAQLVKAFYSGKFNPKLRQMALLRLAHRLPSSYLWHNYVFLVKGLGLTDKAIAVIRSENPVHSLSEEENFLCLVADELTTKATLTDATFEKLYQRYGIELATEFIFCLSASNMIGRFLNATRTPIEEDNPLQGKSTPLK